MTSLPTLSFKEIHCRDCTMVLARYNVKYFTDSKIAELTRIYYQAHIKAGHAIVTVDATNESH
ncbi:MAG TPA: hypothetical protein VEH06_15110 [Candidatus Bathyarchaeia archaeon]|nr:hypothetical protein [Candidatus Bathyarchaeia archaeon]